MTGHSTSSPPISSPSPSSKLPKFLNRQHRDHPKSPTGIQSAPSPAFPGLPTNTQQSKDVAPAHTITRKSSKLFGFKDNDDSSTKPITIEPASPRTRFASNSEPRPTSVVSDSGSYNGGYSSSSSGRLSDFPSRLSGWISHTLTGSSADLSLPAIFSQSQSGATSVSPKSKASGLLIAARHGKGHLDKAMRYILDSDAQPDKCVDPIWVMGVLHQGYEPPPVLTQSTASTSPPARRDSTDSRRSPSSRRSSSSSSYSNSTLSTSPSTSSLKHSPSWPTAFYSDFTSRIWLTYRSHYPPIRDTPLASLDTDTDTSDLNISQSRRWNWPRTGEKTWVSDAGWGCMLRTGQSILANALIHLHLSRDWRRPTHPSFTKDYITYVKILTWFLDSPSPRCPFSVHRMAIAGKELGKDIGQWFGPSTAAGAIKRLVGRFPESQLAVSVAADGVIFDSDVYSASNPARMTGRRRHGERLQWGTHAVLVLVGIRLGIDGVNPVYNEGLKALFTFPQSVGIAGGRPSSSYYFVGSQSDSLFYLDPHHTRPAIVFRPPPKEDDERLPTSQWFVSQAEEDKRRITFQSSNANSRSTKPSPNYQSVSPSPLSQEYITTLPSSIEAQDPILIHYVNAYPLTELRSFHCDRVRKMPLSGLDPSMLLGFLCKDEDDYQDFRHRVSELCKAYKTMFSIQEEPPIWNDDSDDVGMQSVSEPELDDDDDEDYVEKTSFSTSPSPVPPSAIEPSFDNMKPGQFTVDISETHHPLTDVEPEVIVEDDGDDGWVDPLPSLASPQNLESTTYQERKRAIDRLPHKSAIPEQHFPFPSSDNGQNTDSREVYSRECGDSRSIPHLSSIRAKDGGRTQSGGVKGIWMDN